VTPALLLAAAILAGFGFFAWPIRMNQSGLSAPGAMFVYAVVSIAVALAGIAVVPGAWTELRTRSLRIGFEAGVLNVIGVLAFMFVLARATNAEAPRYILIVITLQTALTGAWAAYQAGTIDARLAIGLATALVTVLLLGGR
jgi:hypothetical protein